MKESRNSTSGSALLGERERLLYAAFVVVESMLGVVLSGLVLVASRAAGIAGQDHVFFNNSLAVVGILYASLRVAIRVPLAVSLDLCAAELPLCQFAIFTAFFSVTSLALSVHGSFLQRYSALCHSATLLRGTRWALVLAPYALGAIIARAFLLPQNIDGRTPDGLECRLGPTKADLSWLVVLGSSGLLLLLLVHYVALTFYSLRVRGVIRLRSNVSQTQTDAARLSQDRSLLRLASIQAAAPLALSLPLALLFFARFTGIRALSIGRHGRATGEGTIPSRSSLQRSRHPPPSALPKRHSTSLCQPK